jgi:copper oxidase (laccase) domain-containing protein
MTTTTPAATTIAASPTGSGPTTEFRRHQVRELPRAATIVHSVSDPDRAQQNRLARDQLIADDAIRAAQQHGIRVLEVDGTLDAHAIADTVADHFGPYLPPAT